MALHPQYAARPGDLVPLAVGASRDAQRGSWSCYVKGKQRRKHKRLREDLASLSIDRKRTRFLLDANVDDLAFHFLGGEGYNVKKVFRHGLDDLDVWKISKQTRRLLVTHDRDFWSDRFTLDRSPGLAFLPRQSAEDVVAAVSFLRRWPTFSAGCKICFVSDDQLRIRLRSHNSGRLETIVLDYKGGDWVKSGSLEAEAEAEGTRTGDMKLLVREEPGKGGRVEL